MLEGCAHLQLEGYLVEFWVLGVEMQGARYATDVVQGVVAEAVKLVHLALIDGVFPIDVEVFLSHRGYAIYILVVVGYDAHAEYVGDVAKRLVFMSLAQEFAHERLLGLYARVHLVEFYLDVVDRVFEQLHHDMAQQHILGHFVVVFLQQHGVVEVEFIFHSL